MPPDTVAAVVASYTLFAALVPDTVSVAAVMLAEARATSVAPPCCSALVVAPLKPLSVKAPEVTVLPVPTFLLANWPVVGRFSVRLLPLCSVRPERLLDDSVAAVLPS